jgi:hypothetical protein
VISIIVPVFNEEKILRDVVERFMTLSDPFAREWIFVDDGSTDQSLQILKNLQSRFDFKLISNEQNRGKGFCIQQGLKLVSGHWVTIQDADLEYDPCEIPKLLAPLIGDLADVSFGNRFMGGRLVGQSHAHYLANRLLTFLNNFLSGLRLNDVETCYKVFSSSLIKSMNLSANRFGIEIELAAYVAKAGVRVVELPISYRPRSKKEGKKIGWRDGVVALFHILRFNLLVSKSQAFNKNLITAPELIRKKFSPPNVLLLVGVLSTLVYAGLRIWAGRPIPSVHDEFSYLLAADTFSHFRLTNPTHPLWQHFETFHVFHQPSYMSKYPPAQGLFMALGQILIGDPSIGVLISSIVACMSLAWMLLGWVSPPWALLGAILASVHPQMLSWSRSYWGGSVAVFGGALVLGSIGRIVHQKKTHFANGVLLALGLALLANSRPYEGFVLSLPFLVLILSYAKQISRRLIIAFSITSVLFIAWMGYYNWRVTGDSLKLPYLHHQDLYSSVPQLLFQKPLGRTDYRYPELADYYLNNEKPQFEAQQNWAGFEKEISSKLNLLNFRFTLWKGFWVLLAFSLARALYMRDKIDLFLISSLLFFSSVLLVTEVWMYPHYFAPAFGLLWIIYIRALNTLTKWQVRHRQPGTWAFSIFIAVTSLYYLYHDLQIPYFSTPEWALDRDRIEHELIEQNHKSLVIVRYSKTHSSSQEWVYSGADIDASPVIWVRDAGLRNHEIFDYYRDRQVWYVDADSKSPVSVFRSKQ